jgi:hypothetical protein
MTTDYGETWKAISNGLPANKGTVHVIREHPRDPNLLFAGTEYGLFVSVDRGANWVALKANLPTVPVDDIQIHPRDNDLVLATHGRSIWVLDDIAPLEQLDSKLMGSDLHLFGIRPTIEWRMFGYKGNTGHKWFAAQNPPYGALINFYLKTRPEEKEPVKITISDKAGKVIREIECKPHFGEPTAAPPRRFGSVPCDPRPGINRTNWDLRYAPWAEPTPQQRQAMEAGFGFGPRGPLVEPGQYTVKIAAGKNETTQTVEVQEDPRITVSPADRAARHDAVMKLYALGKTADGDRATVVGLKASLTAALEGWKKPGAPKVPENIQKAAEALAKQIDSLHEKYVAPEIPMGNAGPPLVYTPPPFGQRIGQLMGALEGYTAAPTSQQTEEVATIAKLVGDAHSSVKKLVDEDLAGLNKLMNEAGIPHITPAPAGGEQRGGRR